MVETPNSPFAMGGKYGSPFGNGGVPGAQGGAGGSDRTPLSVVASGKSGGGCLVLTCQY